MNRKQLYALAFVILSASPVWGVGPERPDPISRWLFKPEMIMRFSNQLNLSEQQQNVLKSEVKSAQGSIFDLKWQLNEESETLRTILKTTPIDEDQMLAQADKVMQLEQQIKRIHLTLLARLKNMLSDQQIETLAELRRKERGKRNSQP
jgi:Spy/CpxP family protein refolding chaperone